MNVNALLGFDTKGDDEQEGGKKGYKKEFQPKFQIKDEEGVDFSFYFSEKYNLIHEKIHH